MSNIKNCLKMICLLKTNKLIKKQELAEKLGVTERQVKRYKEELDNYFEIENKPGKYGGYRLIDDNGYFPIKEILTEDEVNLINDFVQSIDSNYFDENNELLEAISKINFTFNNIDTESSSIIPYSRVKPLDNSDKEKIIHINKAIIDNLQVTFKYKGNNDEEAKERRACPYKIITYKGEKYLVAFCVGRKAMRYFKLSRISLLEISTIGFKREIDINKFLKEQRKNSIGIFGGEEYDLKLLISPPMANTISERIWVDNQKIDYLSTGEIKFKATMKGGPEIISWILSMGEHVRILEPNELKEEVRRVVKKMMNNI